MRVRLAVGALLPLCVLAFSVPASAAVSDYLGKPVTSVRLTIEGRDSTEAALVQLVETRVGRPLTMAEVRETLTHLFSLGRFDDVRVDAALEGAGWGRSRRRADVRAQPDPPCRRDPVRGESWRRRHRRRSAAARRRGSLRFVAAAAARRRHGPHGRRRPARSRVPARHGDAARESRARARAREARVHGRPRTAHAHRRHRDRRQPGRDAGAAAQGAARRTRRALRGRGAGRSGRALRRVDSCARLLRSVGRADGHSRGRGSHREPDAFGQPGSAGPRHLRRGSDPERPARRAGADRARGLGRRGPARGFEQPHRGGAEGAGVSRRERLPRARGVERRARRHVHRAQGTALSNRARRDLRQRVGAARRPATRAPAARRPGVLRRAARRRHRGDRGHLSPARLSRGEGPARRRDRHDGPGSPRTVSGAGHGSDRDS